MYFIPCMHSVEIRRMLLTDGSLIILIQHLPVFSGLEVMIPKLLAKLWASTMTGPEAFVNEASGVTWICLQPTMRVSDVQNNAYHYPQGLWDFNDAYNDTPDC